MFPKPGTVVNGDVSAFPLVTNNVQQVVVGNPANGTFQILVRGVSVIAQSPGAETGNNPRQDFSLVVFGGTNLTFQS